MCTVSNQENNTSDKRERNDVEFPPSKIPKETREKREKSRKDDLMTTMDEDEDEIEDKREKRIVRMQHACTHACKEQQTRQDEATDTHTIGAKNKNSSSASAAGLSPQEQNRNTQRK